MMNWKEWFSVAVYPLRANNHFISYQIIAMTTEKFPIEIRDNSDNEYIHWYIIARDYRWQAICEFDKLDWEVFIIEEKNISYKEPTKVEQEIEVNWRTYRLVE